MGWGSGREANPSSPCPYPLPQGHRGQPGPKTRRGKSPRGSKKPHTRAPGPKNCADLPQNMSQPQINPLGDRAGDAPGDLGSPPSGARPRFCSWGSPNLGWRRAAAAFLGPIAARTYLALHQAPPKKRGGGPKTSSPPGGSRPRLLEAGRSRPGSAPTAASSCERRKRRKQAVLTKKKWGFGEGGGSEGGQPRLGSGWWLTGFVMARSQPQEAEGEPSRVIIPKPSGFGAVSPPNFSRFGKIWVLRLRLGDAEGFLFFRAFFQPWCLSRWPGAWK